MEHFEKETLLKRGQFRKCSVRLSRRLLCVPEPRAHEGTKDALNALACYKKSVQPMLTKRTQTKITGFFFCQVFPRTPSILLLLFSPRISCVLLNNSDECRSLRNCDVVVAAGMCLPLAIRFTESTGCKMTAQILQSFQ